MRKFLMTGLTLLLLSNGVSARPWYKDWKVWTVVAISLGSSAAATHWAHECREQFGPAPCNGGYGAFKAREAVRFGLSTGLVAHAIYGRHQGFKEWPIFALGLGAYNTSVAFRQSRIGCPAGQEFIYGTKYSCKLSDDTVGK